MAPIQFKCIHFNGDAHLVYTLRKSEILSSLLLVRLIDNALYRHLPPCFCNSYGASECISQSEAQTQQVML